MEDGSIAQELGIRPGSRLVSVNGRPLRDVIDYRFYTAEELVELEIEVPGGRRERFAIEKHPDESLGLRFATELFDGIKQCRNACPFCFVDGLPRGMRESLYLKDDDYRLSFLHGNFITMTNMDHDDFTRVLDQRLSPLYVSVHSTDPGVRERMLGVRSARRVMEQLRLLVDGGIKVHAQVVVVPGVNDGANLDSTVEDLSRMFPGVASIGVVPVGVTRFQRPCGVRPLSSGELRDLVDWWGDRQPGLRSELGYGFVFLADEVFLALGAPFPPVESYEDLPQYENGIGIGPSFLEDLERLELPGAVKRPLNATVACGELPAPLLRLAAARMNAVNGLRVRVHPVKNRFFGETVTVSGLLTGQDVISALAGEARECDIVLLPAVCLRDEAFLDGMTLEDLSSTLGVRAVASGAGPRELIEILVKEAGGS